MKPLLCFLASCLAVLTAHAEKLGSAVDINPVANWKSVDPLSPGQAQPPFPVLKFAPSDGRNAAILLSLLPADVPGYEVTNLESLKRFNLMAATPYLAQPDATPPLVELKVADGIGGYIVSEDPALVGKPVPPDEYRIAATATLLLAGKYLVNCTIFYDEKDSTDFKEALKILLSASVHRSGTSI